MQHRFARLPERALEQAPLGSSATDFNVRLEAAMRALVGPEPIKDRLAAAYSGHLANIETSDLPLAFQQPFAEMVRVLHQARPVPGLDVVRASICKLSNTQARDYAELVLRLYGASCAQKQVADSPAAAPRPRLASPLPAVLALDTAVSA